MAFTSVSMASVVVSVITVYIYSSAVTSLVRTKYMSSTATYSLIMDKMTQINYTEQEKTMLGISSLVLIFSIFEIIVAFASAMIGNADAAGRGYQSLGEIQVFQTITV